MLPERFGRYEVLAELGDGAMGRVYSAWDPAVSRTVAVKTVKVDSLSKSMADEFVQRFRREAQAAGSLNHPNIVAIYDVGDDHLVMELVEGQTLQEKIRQDGRFEPTAALALLGPVAEALDHAHAAGIIHRDIKPANIMIQPDGQPKLMDFGVAHVDDSVMTATGQVIGSPSYMPPEQVAGSEVTPRSDVYSLAVVAYEMLTGKSPFQAKTITAVIYRVMHDDPPPPRQWNATLPTRYDELFARALAKDPADRFATATEFAGALDVREFELNLEEIVPDEPGARVDAPPSEAAAFGAGETLAETSITIPPAPAPPRAGRRARPWGLVGVLGAAVAVAAAVLFLARSPEAGPEFHDVLLAVPPPLETDTESPLEAAAKRPAARRAPSRATTRKASRPAAGPARTPPEAAATPEPDGDATSTGVVPLGDGVTPPRRVSGAPAPYPDIGRRLRLAGTVTVSMIVGEDGSPLEPRVVESAGDILDQAVLDAIAEWRFEPARRDGEAVRVRWTVRQTFRFSR